MKKFFTLILCAVACLSVYAQNTDLNRLIIRDKGGYTHPYAINNLDSMFFYQIDGRVAADVEVKGVSLKAAGCPADTITLAVTRSESCKSFKIACVKKSIADVITNGAICAGYFDQIESNVFNQDFTNAKMTGFDFQLLPNTEYAIVTLGYDEIGTACEMAKAYFTTPVVPVQGNPEVKYEVADVQPFSISMTFKPNSDVGGYAVTAFGKGEAEQQFKQWGPMMNLASIGEMVKAWGYKGEAGKDTTFTWKDYTPNTEYEIYVQPWDKNGTLTDYFMIPVTTAKIGGEGVAESTIDLKEFKKSDDGRWYQRVVVTQNDQCASHRTYLYTEEEWSVGEDSLKRAIINDPFGQFYDVYGTEDVGFYANPETTYYFAVLSKNANNEWGPLVSKKFTTPKVTDELSKRHNMKAATRVVENKVAKSTNGPVFTLDDLKKFMTVKDGLKLTGK
mgnify:FL=1